MKVNGFVFHDKLLRKLSWCKNEFSHQFRIRLNKELVGR
jgi:hypothetical protein